MLRYFYISNQLQDIQVAQMQLEAEGLRKDQFHVLSGKEADLYKLELNPVSDLEKKDLMNFGLKGFATGLACVAILWSLVLGLGWADSQLDWILFSFLSIAMLGFCTWEGGLIGIQLPNARLKRFQSMLDQNKHIMLVDIDPQQRKTLLSILNKMDGLRFAGAQRLTIERIFSH